MSLDTAVDIVTRSIVPNLRKLPEPIFRADLMSRKEVYKWSKDPYRVQKWNKFIRFHQELDWKERSLHEKHEKKSRR